MVRLPPLDLAALEARVPVLREQYAVARPYPHVVVDDVLAPEAFAAATAELAEIPAGSWTNYLHLNERKYAHKEPSAWGPTLRSVTDAFMSERFVALVGAVAGIDGLRPDPALDGGGLHRSTRGGFLNVHADFTAHHDDPTLRRRVNLLLYLNPTWEPAWGGELELWAADMSACVTRVAPKGNRMLLFTTNETSYHGHPDRLQCPEDVARQSLALYYFTHDPAVRVRSTNYRARPGDGLRGVGVFLDKQVLRAYDVVKRRLKLSDGAASRGLGALRRRGRGASD